MDELGTLQKAVMEAVWALGEATVQEVRERVSGEEPAAYTTILSVMQKLEKAGWLTHRICGRSYVYVPRRTRHEAGASSLRTFIDRVFGGDRQRVLLHLLDDEGLSDADIDALRRMIDERCKENDERRTRSTE
jgi:predicted transcriptional regulator